MKHIHKNKGFTLIELLVVISIIAVLSSVVLASLASAREKARKSLLVQNMEQLQLALEVYKNDTGYYPLENQSEPPLIYKSNDTDQITSIFNQQYNFTNTNNESITQKAFINEYISELPLPMNADWYHYFRGPQLTNYINNGYYCGNKPIKGYMIYYYDRTESHNSPLPPLWDGISQGNASDSCVTGN